MGMGKKRSCKKSRKHNINALAALEYENSPHKLNKGGSNGMAILNKRHSSATGFASYATNPN